MTQLTCSFDLAPGRSVAYKATMCWKLSFGPLFVRVLAPQRHGPLTLTSMTGMNGLDLLSSGFDDVRARIGSKTEPAPAS